MPGRQWSGGSDYRYGFSGVENDKTFNSGALDFGDRIYDSRLGRWFKPDMFMKFYSSVSPYNYCLNSPVQYQDADGNLVIYANGLRFTASLIRGALRIAFPFLPKLGDDRAFANREGVYEDYSGIAKNGKYWSPRIKGQINAGFADYNNLFVDGTNRWWSKTARFDEGVKAALTLHDMLKKGDVCLEPGETIKIVGHSQGGMYAGGMATKLLELGYPVEFVVYIAPHQPTDIVHPDGVKGLQLSRETDAVSSKGVIPSTVARSKYGQINSESVKFIQMQNIKKFSEGFRGHYINTYYHPVGYGGDLYFLIRSYYAFLDDMAASKFINSSLGRLQSKFGPTETYQKRDNSSYTSPPKVE